jgi:hypothetical protein
MEKNILISVLNRFLLPKLGFDLEEEEDGWNMGINWVY